MEQPRAPVPAPPIAPAPPPNRAFRCVWAGLGYFGVYLAAQLLVSVPAALWFAFAAVREVGFSDLSALTAEIAARIQTASMPLTLAVNAVTLAVCYAILRIQKKNVRAELRLFPVPFRRLLPLLPLGVLLNVFLSSLLSLLPASWLAAYEESSALVLGTDLDVFAALMIAVLAPITEEVLFRGLVYTRFSRALPRWLAIALAALLFGVMHMQPVWIAYAACLGALLCAAMDRCGSLIAAIALHMAFNAGSFVVMLLQTVPISTLLPASAALTAGLLIVIFRQPAQKTP